MSSLAGLSKPPTHGDEPPPPPPKDEPLLLGRPSQENKHLNGRAKENERLEPLDTTTDLTNGQLFTAEELAKAMSRSTLEPAHERR